MKNSLEKIVKAAVSVKHAKTNLADHPYLVYRDDKKWGRTCRRERGEKERMKDEG